MPTLKTPNPVSSKNTPFSRNQRLPEHADEDGSHPKGIVDHGSVPSDPTPLPSDNRFHVWERSDTGEVWGAVNGSVSLLWPNGGAFTLRATADETVSASITLQNDDEMLFAIAANETWMFHFYLWFAGTEASDLVLHVTGPAGSTVTYSVHGLASAATAGAGNGQAWNIEAILGPDGVAQGQVVGIDAAMSLVEVRGMCRNGATAGNVQLQWAQNVAAGSAVRQEDSYVVAFKEGLSPVGGGGGGGGGVTDHGALTGLTDDDHSIYPLLLGRATGQTIAGGTAANEDLTLTGTTHATTTTSAVIISAADLQMGTAGRSILDSGGTARITLATTGAPGPNVTLTGGVQVTSGGVGINVAPRTGSYLFISNTAANNDGLSGAVIMIGASVLPAAGQVVGLYGYAFANDGTLTTTVTGLSFNAGMTGTSWNGVTLASIAAIDIKLWSTSSVGATLSDFWGISLPVPTLTATTFVLTRYTGMIMNGVSNAKIQKAVGFKMGSFGNAGTVNAPLELDGPARTTNNDGSFHTMNMQFGSSTRGFGGGAGVISLFNATTAPTGGATDCVIFYSSDDAAGHTIPSFYAEGTNVLATGQADSVSSVRVKMRINGTVVTLLGI